jgi:hypothetical protein
VLYRLPKVLKADEVLVVAGEKDVETAERLGFVATTNSGGEGKWRPEYAECLRGKRVTTICHADPTGVAHGHDLARSVVAVAASLKLIEALPKAKDLTEWVELGGGDLDGAREQLLQIIHETPVLRNVKVSAEIQKAMRRRAHKLEFDAGKVLQEIAALASANISDYLKIDHRGKVRLNLYTLTRDSAKGLVEYRVTKHGFSIKLTDSLRALELLGEHLGLFAERHEHDLSLTQGIAELTHFLGLDRMSPEELKEASKFLAEPSETSRLGPQPDNGREIVIKRQERPTTPRVLTFQT